MIANGVSDLHGQLTMQRLAQELGIDDSVNKNTIHNALRRWSAKNINYSNYQFEDEAFADWVKHRG